jgi:hypothetical protein
MVLFFLFRTYPEGCFRLRQHGTFTFIVGSFFARPGEKRTHNKPKSVCLRKFYYCTMLPCILNRSKGSQKRVKRAAYSPAAMIPARIA